MKLDHAGPQDDDTRRPAGDRGAAMLTALMLVLVVGTLSLLVLGTLVSQVRPIAFAQKAGRTVFAAEAGQQVALGELRTSVAGSGSLSGYGDPAQLPCSLEGAVGAPEDQLTYVVTVQYFAEDPSGKNAAWREVAALDCLTTSRGVGSVPAFAIISSQGRAAGVPGLATTTGNRWLETQYAFQRTNENIPGGLFRTSDLAFCLEAESAEEDSEVFYRSDCAPTDLNLWVHDDNSYIVLASSITEGGPSLCLQGPAAGADPADSLVRLAPCDVVGRQLFSYKGYFQYQGQNDDNTGLGTGCLWAGVKHSALEGQALHSSSAGCVGGGNESAARTWWSWNPEPAVGAGSASLASSKQFISYEEFGRCLEVTQENLWAANMGIGPCKQSVPGNGNRWNQVWEHDEPTAGASSVPTILKVARGTAAWEIKCLTTPAETAPQPAFPKLEDCDPALATQTFLRTTQTSDYATSYQILDTYGRCLGGGPTYTPDDSVLTSVVVEPCTGALDQKWNAPPNTTPPGQSNTSEGVQPAAGAPTTSATQEDP